MELDEACFNRTIFPTVEPFLTGGGDFRFSPASDIAAARCGYDI
jgi:hypothetical protein